MNTATPIYEYKLLHGPTIEDINAVGAAGYRLHSLHLDPRDGSLAYAAMERIGNAVLIEELCGAINAADEKSAYTDNGKPFKGRKR